MKTLVCTKVQIPGGDFEYTVYDDKDLVANGVSSTKAWVRHDAGGYHTKEKFDKLYPDGWEVVFKGFFEEVKE